jgi:hypothetical protein
MTRIRRLLAALVIAALLVTELPHPPEVHADDTAIIVIASIAGYFAVVLLITYLIRNRDSGFSQSSVSPLLPAADLPQRPSDGGRTLRLAAECGIGADAPPLLCW